MSMASRQTDSKEENMGRSKRCSWFIRYCCCCCKCCVEDDVHRPLLHSTTPKELTPTSTKEDGLGVEVDAKAGVGEETQQMELVVAEIESEGQRTPEADSDAEQDKQADQEQEKPAEVDVYPTERARVESGTFVRGASQRASWRLVPSVTRQVKETAAATTAVEGAEGSHDAQGQKQIEATQTESASEEVSLNFTTDQEESPESQQKPYRNVTLVAQDVEDEEGTAEESVTMTFTIGSRGTQEAAPDHDLEPIATTTAAGTTNSTTEEQQQQQGVVDHEGLEETRSNSSASGVQKAIDGSNSIEATTPILTDKQ